MASWHQNYVSLISGVTCRMKSSRDASLLHFQFLQHAPSSYLQAFARAAPPYPTHSLPSPPLGLTNPHSSFRPLRAGATSLRKACLILPTCLWASIVPRNSPAWYSGPPLFIIAWLLVTSFLPSPLSFNAQSPVPGTEFSA